MVIALVLLTAWVALNVVLLGAVAYANHRGQVRAAAPVAPKTVRRSAPVFVVAH